MTIAIIFGGSGYIGTNLLSNLNFVEKFDVIYVFDIQTLVGFEEEQKSGKIIYEKIDVRELINFKLNNIDSQNSWIFNLAAIHREPGHQFQEYFDTNVPGAENINDFARQTGIKNILFTSSIAPYGSSLHEKTEQSPLYPETAYGISKTLAEKIHQQWLSEDSKRRLIIIRPSVIFGPKDPGNIYRMIKALKKGTFILPNNGNIVKAYGYIYGLIDSILFVMERSKEKLIIYNYAENPLVSLKGLAQIIKKELIYSKPTLKIPVRILTIISFLIQGCSGLFGIKSDIHPVRVKKASFPTNIKPQYLIENNFQFKYDFTNALKHWKSVCPKDFE